MGHFEVENFKCLSGAWMVDVSNSGFSCQYCPKQGENKERWGRAEMRSFDQSIYPWRLKNYFVWFAECLWGALMQSLEQKGILFSPSE